MACPRSPCRARQGLHRVSSVVGCHHSGWPCHPCSRSRVKTAHTAMLPPRNVPAGLFSARAPEVMGRASLAAAAAIAAGWACRQRLACLAAWPRQGCWMKLAGVEPAACRNNVPELEPDCQDSCAHKFNLVSFGQQTAAVTFSKTIQVHIMN